MAATSKQTKSRPAFLVDERLKKAAGKASEVFLEEEKALKKALAWSDSKKSGY